MRALAIAGLLLAGGALYTTRLQVAPIYLMQDEVNFSLQAQSIASTGRDTNGRLLPLYFAETGFEAGRDPVIIYATALGLILLPLSEAAVRLPTAVVGVVDLVLMWWLALRIFKSDRLALLAAALLAMTPGHFLNSRLALSILYPIPFILGWLLCLSYVETPRERRWLFAATAILGLGLYSYLASVLMMPLYLIMTALFLRERGAGRLIWPATAAFALTLVPLVAWQIVHPTRYLDLVHAYRPLDAGPGDPLQDLTSLVNFDALRQRVGVVWTFFSPDRLFLSGDSRMTNSTRSAGMFPLAFAGLLPVGLYALARGQFGALGRVVLLGFITAPLASAVSGRLEINRVLFAIPFGVLASTYGVQHLLGRTSRAARWTALALVATVPLQFWGFYTNYMGAYRVASSLHFGGDQRGAVTEVLRNVGPGSAEIYLSRTTAIERYWRFYALAQGRADLTDRPMYYDPARFDPTAAQAGALLVCDSGEPLCGSLRASGAWDRLSTIIEPAGTPSFDIYKKR